MVLESTQEKLNVAVLIVVLFLILWVWMVQSKVVSGLSGAGLSLDYSVRTDTGSQSGLVRSMGQYEAPYFGMGSDVDNYLRGAVPNEQLVIDDETGTLSVPMSGVSGFRSRRGAYVEGMRGKSLPSPF